MPARAGDADAAAWTLLRRILNITATFRLRASFRLCPAQEGAILHCITHWLGDDAIWHPHAGADRTVTQGKWVEALNHVVDQQLDKPSRWANDGNPGNKSNRIFTEQVAVNPGDTPVDDSIFPCVWQDS